jgi:ABC-type branched-subunit amino acid transport system permease subunit
MSPGQREQPLTKVFSGDRQTRTPAFINYKGIGSNELQGKTLSWSFSGGCGSVVNSLFGMLVISVLETGLAQLGAQEPVKRLVTGGVIVAAVIVDFYRTRRAARR